MIDGATLGAGVPRLALRTRVWSALSTPVDIAWLALFRILFGLTMCVSMLRFLAYGWIDALWVTPTFHFKYWGFHWVEALPGPLMHGLFVLLALLSLCVALGLWFRLTALLFVLGFSYLQLIDVATYLNHYYLAALLGLLLLLSPAHRALSLDCWRKPRLELGKVSGFWLLLFRFQIATVYTYAGLAKLHGDWLLHAQPLRIWLSSRTDMPWIGRLFTLPEVPLLMSWAGFLFDTSIAWLLLSRRLRPFAYLLVLLFHALTRALFPIGMFPFIMVLSALVFFSPEWPRRLLCFVPALRSPPALRPSGRVPGKLALALAALFCVVQFALPLRFLAYGGNVRWHEQGMRLSWRVMVREKNGSISYVVHSPKLGKRWYVNPRRYLTPLQERELSGQPDLILQLAQHVGREFEQKGLGAVEVRAEAYVSLNGRPSALLIDPRVDLTKVRDGLAPAAWILPAPDHAPPHIQPI